MSTLNIKSRTVPRTSRNGRIYNDSSFAVATTGGGSGSSWLEQYVTYDSDTETLNWIPSLTSQGDVQAWLENPEETTIWDSIPIASDVSLGAIMVGTGLSIDELGVLSATGAGSLQTLSYVHPTLSISGGNSVDLSHTHSYDNYNSWLVAAESTAGTSSITSGSTVTFTGSGDVSVTRSGNTIDIYCNDTWRSIDNTPVNGVTTQSISSNWAYDHNAASNPHGTTLDNVTDAGSSTSNSISVGSLTASGEVTAYSDKRVKYDLKKIDNSLEKVTQLTGYTFNRLDIETKKRYAGLIAQDVQKVLPEAITEKNNRLSVNDAAVTGLLVEAIKELKAEINELKKQLKDG